MPIQHLWPSIHCTDDRGFTVGLPRVHNVPINLGKVDGNLVPESGAEFNISHCGGVVVPDRAATRASGLFTESTRFLPSFASSRLSTTSQINTDGPCMLTRVSTGLRTHRPCTPPFITPNFALTPLSSIVSFPVSRIAILLGCNLPPPHIQPRCIHTHLLDIYCTELRRSLHPMTTGGRGRR